MIAIGTPGCRLVVASVGLLAGGLPPGTATALGPARDGGPAAATPEAIAFFEGRIRPVLAEQCLSCHGDRKQTSGLRLDSRAAILEGGFIEGPAVLLDEPEASPLLLAVRHEIEAKMPPEGRLPAEVVADLERWVGMGLPWPDDATIPTPEDAADAAASHWAFQPVSDPAPPSVSDSSWVASPVDAFVLERLDEEDLRPSPPADRATLLRRVGFDLIGLPPTPEEVDAFLDDPRPDDEAFAAVVDRLLASPRYGERWGRHWLDVARYADTKGYVFAEERRYPYAYTYRDYVVRSFNEDKPFDRFVLEQLAADALGLPEGDPGLAAMGFLTVGQRFLNNRHDVIDDRIDVVGRGLMGLTIACARCHDHKYDPIPTADYYALHGVFDSSVEPESLPLIAEVVAPGGPDREDFFRQLAGREEKVAAFVRSTSEAIGADFRDRLPAYLDAASALDFGRDRDGREGRARDDGAVDREARARDLPPRRLGGFLGKWSALLERAGSGHDPIFAPWHALAELPADTFAEQVPGILDALLADPETPINPVVASALREPTPPTSFAEVVERYGAALSAPGDEGRPGRADLAALFGPGGGPLAVAEDEVRGLFERDERDKHRKLLRELDEVQATHAGAPPRAMVLVDAERPTEPAIFLRGNPGNRGPRVPRQFLELLEGDDREPFSEGSGRLELARKVADPANPLTGRVLVNRLWMHHFGRPIVGTPSDFGIRSDPPSHPELLDFLARRLVDGEWSIKAMHRMILASNTYRQASLDRPEASAIDPENLLLWRQNRRRLELEPMRDAMLAVAGRLDPRLGGRPGPGPSDPAGARRTLYSMIDRTFLDGVYRTFDFASTDASSPDRPETTVPQQALFLMNSPFVAEQARRLARRAVEETGSNDPAARVERLYRLLFGRVPGPGEVEVGLRFLAMQGEVTEAPVSPWRYGYGGFDEEAGRVASFGDLPHWTGESWQFGPELPDPEGRFLHLKADGGHVGHGPERAAIRRWVAPSDAVVRIEGRLAHRNAEGDGVRARVVAERGGLLGEWVAHDGRARTVVDRFEVEAGEAIDFVVDGRGGPNHDSFEWAPVVRVELPDGTSASWDARSDFSGPPSPPPTPEEQYAQALLMTNEFLFVD